MQEGPISTIETAFQKFSLRDLLDNPGISSETNTAIITSAPCLQHLSPEKAREIKKRIQETNKKLPEMAKFVLEILMINLQSTSESVDSLDSEVNRRKIGIETFTIIEYLMENEHLQKELNIDDKDIHQIALTQIGLGLAINLYRSAEESEKSLWLAYASYYAALQSLATGIRTGGTTFIANADDENFVVPTDEVSIIGIANKEQLEGVHIRWLYEGVPLTPIREFGENESYFIAYTKSGKKIITS